MALDASCEPQKKIFISIWSVKGAEGVRVEVYWDITCMPRSGRTMHAALEN